MKRLPAGPSRVVRRRPWRAAEYAALDFETTGLDYEKDSIVSFGLVPVIQGRAMLAGSAHQLVSSTVPPSPRSQSFHLLRPQDLDGAPPVEHAREQLRGLLAGRFILAWFAEVEIRFLASMFRTGPGPWRRRTIDVRNLAITVAGGGVKDRAERGYALGTQAAKYGVPIATPHEAYDDALVTAQLFMVLAAKLGSGEPTVRDLLRLGGPNVAAPAAPGRGIRPGRNRHPRRRQRQ